MMAAGILVYELGAEPCSGQGRAWSKQEWEAALAERVTPLVFDDEGGTDIEEILTGLVDGEFEPERLRKVLSGSGRRIKDWRVGEATAEAYMTDHRSCHFPWPVGRDERKGGSSLPGADLVGFRTDEDGDRFVFGEVKTSSEARYPPGVMHGRTGLKRQLEDLRDREDIRRDLFLYLGHRAKNASWHGRFKGAGRRYLRNSSDVHLYGVLIRDVVPHRDDLNARVERLGSGCPRGTRIELLALYLPEGTITGIGSVLVAQRTGGDA